MLKRSVSEALASPSAQIALTRSLVATASRTAALRRFESSSAPSSRVEIPASGRIAAHATTGPANGPRPASSTPQITAPDLRPSEIS